MQCFIKCMGGLAGLVKTAQTKTSMQYLRSPCSSPKACWRWHRKFCARWRNRRALISSSNPIWLRSTSVASKVFIISNLFPIFEQNNFKAGEDECTSAANIYQCGREKAPAATMAMQNAARFNIPPVSCSKNFNIFLIQNCFATAVRAAAGHLNGPTLLQDERQAVRRWRNYSSIS